MTTNPSREILLENAICGEDGSPPWFASIRQVREAGEGYERFLLAMATRELEQKQANQVQRRFNDARFPLLKPLETTDLKKSHLPFCCGTGILAFCRFLLLFHTNRTKSGSIAIVGDCTP